jgi:hypothetical protein
MKNSISLGSALLACGALFTIGMCLPAPPGERCFGTTAAHAAIGGIQARGASSAALARPAVRPHCASMSTARTSYRYLAARMTDIAPA